ncbi:hypothetical protein EZV62_027889 [Acer yangbiense]|uniref:Cation-transporting P-type ATPase N-terminal domain-containing protein n=1 Tax=Acer yangbiense TaxID=1000413 RepID=A0A5C7GPW6_9ROSI|nr:hypothetical protein EZV62_027889 [Acer yangbiense]
MMGLDAVNREAVDLENIPIEEVFENLKCTRAGLTSGDVKDRLDLFGYNKLEDKKVFVLYVSSIGKQNSEVFGNLGFMWNPLSRVMEAAAIMAIALAHGGGKDPDYPDFVGIIILLLINSAVSFIEENNAGNAAAALMAGNRWSEEDASGLVPGGIVSIKLGDIVLADARLLEGDPLKIDQVVTLHKCIHAIAHSSCLFRVSDQREHAVPVKTFNVGSYWGISSSNQESWRRGLLKFNVQASCIICSNHGHLRLVQGAITKRTTAIEEMAGMDVLCNDKTGTLTQNKLTVDKNMIEVFAKGVDRDMVVLMAARASRLENQEASDGAIVAMLSDPKEILHLAHNKSEIEQGVHAIIIDKFVERGLRSLQLLAVPAGTKDSPGGGGGPWEFVGLLPLFDRPRHDSAEMIRRALDLGDQLAIGKETGRRLGMGTNMYPSSALLGESKGSTDAAHSASDIVLTEPGLSVIISTIMNISKDRVKPSPLPDSWKLSEIFATEVVHGSYLTLMTIVFFYAANETNFFTKHFHVRVKDFNQHHFNTLDDKVSTDLNGKLASSVKSAPLANP